MILHLIRHPRPAIAEGVCYGRLDIPAENPVVAAARLRDHLPPGVPLWSSPLQRCRALASELHAQPAFDERLVEMDFGIWEGQPWDAIPRIQLDAWAADVADFAPPGGESPQAVLKRALAFVAGLQVPEAIVVTHGGVIRTLVAHTRNLPPARWCELDFAYASHTIVQFGR
jgi:alpha-ribazole phosphatase